MPGRIGFKDLAGQPMPAVEALFCYLDPASGYVPFSSDRAAILIRPCYLPEEAVVGCMWLGPINAPVGLTRHLLRDMGCYIPPSVIDYFPWRLRMMAGDWGEEIVYYLREEFWPEG